MSLLLPEKQCFYASFTAYRNFHNAEERTCVAYRHQRATVKGAMLFPSGADKERMRPDHWLGIVLRLSFSVSILLDG